MATSPASAGDSPGVPNDIPRPAAPRRKQAPTGLLLVISTLSLAIIIGLGYFIVYPQLNAGWHWRQAKIAIQNRDLTKAEDHLRSCLHVWSTDGEVHFLMARTYRRLGKFDPARDHLQQAAKHHWVPEQIKLERLLLKAQTGAGPETTRPLQEILKEGHRDDIYIFEALIIGCLQANNFVEANRWTTVWLEQHPDDWLARFWLGVVLEEAHEYDLAAQEYQKALDLNANGWQLHLRLAEVLMQPNPTEEALVHFEAALAAEPNHPAALLGLAQCQHSLGRNEAAKTNLERLVELDPQNIGGYCLHGKMALEEDKPEQALEWLQKARAINPHHLVTNKQLVQVFHKLRRDSEAKEAEQRVEEIEQLNARLDEITKELLKQPKDVSLRLEAGDILFKLGDYQKAFPWFVSALLIDPQHPPAKEATKKCLQRMGDKELLERYQPILEDPR